MERLKGRDFNSQGKDSCWVGWEGYRRGMAKLLTELDVERIGEELLYLEDEMNLPGCPREKREVLISVVGSVLFG